MKCIMTIVVLITTLSTVNVFGQLGRYEQPIDTLPIGGDEQENKTLQMERHDELRRTLVALQDSVSAALDDKSLSARQNTLLAEQQEKIGELISEFTKTEREVSLMKEAEIVIKETRLRLRGRQEQ